MRLLGVAVGFLTRVPVPRTAVGPDDLRRAAAFFPLVGLGVAGVGIAARAAVTPLWGTAVATVAAILAMALVTGAFHEDGLADTADGLWGAWTPAARLAIMRDSRIGTFGTTALIAAFTLRIALLLPLGLPDFARAVACAHVLGRASSLVLPRLLPPAEAPGPERHEQPGLVGRGDPAWASPRVGDAPEATASAEPGTGFDAAKGEPSDPGRPRLGASVVGPLEPWGVRAAAAVALGTGGVAAGAWVPVPLAAGLVVCLGCAGMFRRRLGGFSGDALGAANVLVELATMAAVVALARAGLM